MEDINNRKKYETPEIEITEIKNNDIIMTSDYTIKGISLYEDSITYEN